MKYRINEHFYSLQGEGVHSGSAAYFIRLQGCDQKCHFCDSAGTWHKDWKPDGVLALDAQATADLVQAPDEAFVVLTGGEPALYDLQPLLDCLPERFVHIETAGHRPLPRGLHWVTMSPKLFAAHPLPENWQRADEIKLVVEGREQLKRDLDLVLENYHGQTIWLMPEWSHFSNWYDFRIKNLIVEKVKEMPFLRAGFQMHKLFMADHLDPNARREIIPLGGVKNE